MHKLLVFDLDGTLAQPGEGMLPENVNKLIQLEQMGYKIALCSGKTSYYLCGFARQLGLREPILIGENGATFQFGIDLPPKRYEVYPYSEKAREQRERMRMLINDRYDEKIWYQPNEVGLSPFPMDENLFEDLQQLIKENREQLSEFFIYRHFDCFDLVPKNINKHNGVKYLSELLNLEAKDVVAVGDGVNDIPMFEFADVSIGIIRDGEDSVQASQRLGVERTFTKIGQALDFIIENML